MKQENEKLLIFDCDGVLVDSEPLSNKVLVQCLRNEGFDVDDLYGRRFIGIALKDCLKLVESEFQRKISEGFIDNLSLLTHEEIKNNLKPIPNIDKALSQLPQPKCIASGSDHSRLKLSLEVTGLTKYFQHIYSATEVPKGKPEPDVFLYAAQKMNFSNKDCVVIEDSHAGVQAGLAAGMKVLLYKPTEEGFPVPEEVIVFSDMAELPSLLN